MTAALDTLLYGREHAGSEVCLKVLCVLDPRPLIDTWSCSLLQSEETCPQDLNVDVMQERRQLVLSIPGDGFSYAGLRA